MAAALFRFRRFIYLYIYIYLLGEILRRATLYYAPPVSVYIPYITLAERFCALFASGFSSIFPLRDRRYSALFVVVYIGGTPLLLLLLFPAYIYARERERESCELCILRNNGIQFMDIYILWVFLFKTPIMMFRIMLLNGRSAIMYIGLYITLLRSTIALYEFEI